MRCRYIRRSRHTALSEIREAGDGFKGGEGLHRRGAEAPAEGVADGEEEVHVADAQRTGPSGGLHALHQGGHSDALLGGVGEHHLAEGVQILVLPAPDGVGAEDADLQLTGAVVDHTTDKLPLNLGWKDGLEFLPAVPGGNLPQGHQRGIIHGETLLSKEEAHRGHQNNHRRIEQHSRDTVGPDEFVVHVFLTEQDGCLTAGRVGEVGHHGAQRDGHGQDGDVIPCIHQGTAQGGYQGGDHQQGGCVREEVGEQQGNKYRHGHKEQGAVIGEEATRGLRQPGFDAVLVGHQQAVVLLAVLVRYCGAPAALQAGI